MQQGRRGAGSDCAFPQPPPHPHPPTPSPHPPPPTHTPAHCAAKVASLLHESVPGRRRAAACWGWRAAAVPPAAPLQRRASSACGLPRGNGVGTSQWQRHSQRRGQAWWLGSQFQHRALQWARGQRYRIPCRATTPAQDTAVTSVVAPTHHQACPHPTSVHVSMRMAAMSASRCASVAATLNCCVPRKSQASVAWPWQESGTRDGGRGSG